MRLAASLTTAALLMAAVASDAGAEGTVAILNGDPIEVELAAGQSVDVPIDIVNSGVHASTMRLLAVESTQGGGKTLALAASPEADGVVARSDAIPAGGRWRPVLRFTGAAAERRIGCLVVLDGMGGLDRRTITVEVKQGTPVLAAEVLREPLPDPVTLRVTRVGPGPLTPLILPPTLHLDPTLTATISSGPLLSGDGDVMVVNMGADGELSVSDAPAAGTYQGSIARVGDDGVETMASLQIEVRDLLLWPLAIILVGIALAAAGADLVDRGLPRGLLRARLADLRERSTKLSSGQADVIRLTEPWFGDDRLPVRLLAEDPDRGALWVASDDALGDFDTLASTALREDRWGAHGKELEQVVGLLDRQRSVGERALGINQHVIEVRDELSDGLIPAFESSAIWRRLGPTLAGPLLLEPADLEQLEGLRGDLADRLGEMRGVLRGLRLMDELPGVGGGDRQEIAVLRTNLASLTTGEQQEIAGIAREAQVLYDRIVRRTAVARTPEESPDIDGLDEIRSELETPFAVDTGGSGFEEDRGIPAATLADQVRQISRIIVVGSVGAVVLGGVATQYLPNATFGSLADYAGLLAWSTVAAAAGQVVKSVGTARATASLLGDRREAAPMGFHESEP